MILVSCSGNKHIGQTKQDENALLQNESINTLDDKTVSKLIGHSVTSFTDFQGVLTDDHFLSITSIELADASLLQSLQGLEKFINLEYLLLSNCKKIVSDCDLRNLKKLTSLVLENIDSLTLDFTVMPSSLQGLVLNNCTLKNVTGLSNTSLVTLGLWINNFKDFPFQELPFSLKNLTISRSGIDSIAFLSPVFSHIKSLDCSSNNIESLDDVRDWGVLEYVNLYENPIVKKYVTNDSKKSYVLVRNGREIFLSFSMPY